MGIDDFQELISTCEMLLSKQDRLIADFEAAGHDLTDARELRTLIANFLTRSQAAIVEVADDPREGEVGY